MIRAFFLAAMLWMPCGTSAQISDADKSAIVERAETFRAAVLDENGIELSIDTMYPPFADIASLVLGLGTPDELFTRMRLGYTYSTSQLQVVQKDLLYQEIAYGVAGEWVWGIVPFASQSRWIATQELTDQTCLPVLIFGQDGIWYSHSMDDMSDPILISILPEFEFLNTTEVECSTGTS